MCFSPNHLGGPLLNLLQFINVFPILVTQSWTLQSNEFQVSRIIISLSPCRTIFCWYSPGHYWLPLPVHTSGSCSVYCPPCPFWQTSFFPASQSLASLNHCTCIVYFLDCIILHLSLLNFVMFINPFLQAKSLWMPALLLGMYSHSCPCLVSPAHLVILCSTVLSRSLIKMLNRLLQHC